MRGQLWESCGKRGCDTEPVCVDCGYCERHCKCAQDATDAKVIRDVNQKHPGLLRRVVEHQEDGARER